MKQWLALTALLIFYGCSGSCNVRSVLKRQWEELFPNEILFLYDRFWPAHVSCPRVVLSAHTQSETLRKFMPLRTNRSYYLLAIVHLSFRFVSNPSSLDAKNTRYHAFGMSGIVNTDTNTFPLATCQWLSHLLVLIVSRTHSFDSALGVSFILYVRSNCHFDDFCQTLLTWLTQRIGSSVLISNDQELIWGFHIMSNSKMALPGTRKWLRILVHLL